MELTETQSALIQLLKLLNIEEKAIITILLALQEEKQMLKMIDYIDNHRNATQQEITEQLLKIMKK